MTPRLNRTTSAAESPSAMEVLVDYYGESARSSEVRRQNPRGRALIGLLVLILAAAAMIGLNGLAPERIPGVAVADWPPPPAVGSCVNLADGVVVVSCSEPHDAEVTKAYPALDPVLAASPSATIDAACASAMGAYLGRGTAVRATAAPRSAGGASASGGNAAGGSGDAAEALRAIGLQASAASVSAPHEQRAGDRGWSACVVMPTARVRYLGTVRGATAASAPDAYRLCWGAGGEHDPVSCTVPHQSEVLSVATFEGASEMFQSVNGARTSNSAGSAEAAASAAQRRAADSRRMNNQIGDWQRYIARQCDAQAATILRRSDPTFGGILTVGTDSDSISATLFVRVPAGASAPSSGEGSGSGSAGSSGTGLTNSSGTGLTDGSRAGLTDSSGGTGSATGEAPGQGHDSIAVIVLPRFVYCTVSAPEGRQLTRSLIGWGHKPLPLTGG